jgi:DNA-binding XRE family transcriptional regulator
MKMRPTDQGGEILLTVPRGKETLIGEAIQKFLELSGYTVDAEDDDDRLYSVAEVFPDLDPAMALRGLRTMEDLTQAELASRLGVTQNNISNMERGVRAITKQMAQRIEKEFGVSYKVFL